MFYFGCKDGESGHHLWSAGWKIIHEIPGTTLQPILIDTAFCPGVTKSPHGYWRTPDDQPEGSAKLTHAQGWTVIAFWDRSVDPRIGANSAFLIEGTLSSEEVLAAARVAFPEVMARFTFEVRLT